MNFMQTAKAIGISAGLALITITGAAAQADYPTKPITFLVPYAAGGNGDIVSRIVANALQAELGQPVVIQNRPGAGGNIGAAEAARMDPDGYTILLATNTHTINQNLYDDAGYDLRTSFAPVSSISSAPMMLVVNSQLPVQSVAEFVDLAKAEPLNYSTSGNGSSGHLYMALFEQRAGVELTNIPYSAVAAGLTDLIAGRVQATFSTVASTLEMVKGGQLRPLAIAAPERSHLLPDVPTLAESGIEGIEEGIWQGIVVPAGTPEEVIAILNAAIVEVLGDETVKAQLEQQGLDANSSTPEEFGTLIAAELERWGAVIDQAGVTLQ